MEQVAEIIGVELTDYQKAVSDNDKGYVDLMLERGYKQEVINAAREQDRVAQGITKKQEEQAESAIAALKVYGTLTVIDLPHDKCATVTDRLYGKYINLLVTCGNGEVNFYGDGYTCLKLQDKFGGYTGGQLPKQGFWGGFIDKNLVIAFLKEVLRYS